jgi:dTDP-4-dehydrorhamnose 3,5-epimerase
VVVPPQVWHGVQNAGGVTCVVANMPDQPYRYDNPDHWRVPPDSPHVPYAFVRQSGSAEAI